ncbi:MAG: hypothetical protein JNL74_01235 [Fibrobacteres bacterium]|nr:hypothetical protein [Fibrobacterota bacterium]
MKFTVCNYYVKLALIMLICSFAVSSQENQSVQEFGANAGWEHPYGNSIEYSHSLSEHQLFGGGVGFSFNGIKFGLGYKYLINSLYSKKGNFNPYIGLYASYAGGFSKVNVNVNSDTAVYKTNSGVTATPRAGLRLSLGNACIYANAGYAILVKGGGVEYVSGSREQSVANFANYVGLGGLEISGSFCFIF